MQRTGHFVGRKNDLNFALAPHHHAFLAVLRGLDRVDGGQRARWLGYGTKHLRHRKQCALRIELARDQQRGVVWLIVEAIKSAQIVDVHVLNIAAITNRQIAVVVPVKRGRKQALGSDRAGLIFALLKLVSDHREFFVQILFFQEGVDHAIRLQLDGEFEVVFGRRQRDEIVSDISTRGGVHLCAAL